MKKNKNSYKKSGVNISLADKLVKHISNISKKDIKKNKASPLKKDECYDSNQRPKYRYTLH